MRNNTVFTIVYTVVIITAIIIGTMMISYRPKNIAGDSSADVYNWFYQIGDTPIVYEKNTRVMYYCTGTAPYRGYMAPYYNEHGQICRYIDGEIVPIE